ncbi:hypothetical protein BDZ97DRAFT_1916194 [Flammula alnicola]|nr:hypothetical protein BDZ97DRAFT_1916194 [Flammula alnicola]
MGNSSSSGRGHHDETVDYGSLIPQGVYTGPRDWNQAIVSQLIVARKLAPFYRPLEDYEESWDDDQILAARKELPDPDNADTVTRIEATATATAAHKSKKPGALKEPSKPEAQVYRGAVECPICFLCYPPNINHSRCCDQAICTECFVQIKRAEPTTTHLVSEPAACPYCVQDNFGVVYTPPPWRAGLGSDGSIGLWSDAQRSSEPTAPPTHKRRQKSFSADSPDVVTTDQIRPDWEAKLDAVRAAVARRANRRIIMRQVGDRLIPVGVTSGRVHALTPEEAAAAGADGSRRSRRRQGPQGGGFEQFMSMGGQDLEELMMMEAMRLSLLDHEEHQRKEAEEKKKQEAAAASASAAGGGDGAGASSSSDISPADTVASSEIPAPGPGPSTLEARSSIPSSSNLSSSVTSIPRSVSPSPKHNKVDSQESLGPGRKSWSLSRSRTPPPPPANPAPNIPISEENQAAWRSRSAGPPAFSTLNAALTSTSTATAFLGATSSGEQRPSGSAPPEPSHGVTANNVAASRSLSTASQEPAPLIDLSTPIPTITVVNNETTPGAAINPFEDPSYEDASASTATPVPSSSLPRGLAVSGVVAQVPSAMSSITSLEGRESGAGASSYGHLPSSDSAGAMVAKMAVSPNGQAPISACLPEILR